MYEVKFIKQDGKEALILVTPFLSEAEDTVSAAKRVEYERVEIWREGQCIRMAYRQESQKA